MVVGMTECTISDTSSTPWRYEVTASIGTTASAPSTLTQPVPHRILVILAGQSNTIGAESFATDPVTGIGLSRPRPPHHCRFPVDVGWLPWNVDAPKHQGKTDQVKLDTPQIENWLTPDHQIFGPESGGLARSTPTPASP